MKRILFLTFTIISIGTFANEAVNENFSLSYETACGEATNIAASFSYCIEKADQSEDLTPFEIEACGEATNIAASFRFCLDEAEKNEVLSVEQIVDCGEATSIAASFRNCLKH